MIDRDSEEMRAIRKSIAELSRGLGGERSPSISLRLTINDRIQARVLPIDILTFTSDRGEEPYDATEDSSPQRYRLQEVECVVPARSVSEMLAGVAPQVSAPTMPTLSSPARHSVHGDRRR